MDEVRGSVMGGGEEGCVVVTIAANHVWTDEGGVLRLLLGEGRERP